jgi:hypothetical protein
MQADTTLQVQTDNQRREYMTITITGKTISVFLLVFVLLAIVGGMVILDNNNNHISDRIFQLQRDHARQFADLNCSIDSLKSVVLRLDSISTARDRTTKSPKYILPTSFK